MTTLSTRYLLTAITVALLLMSRAVHGLDITLTLNEESEYTTNSARTEDDEVEEWIHAPGASFTAAHEGPSLQLDVDYEFRRLLYQQDLFDDENEAAGSANLTWSMLPERLDVIATHTRTQTAIRSIESITPDNRQETINTAAGPRLRFNPRGDDEIQIEYLYGDRSRETTDTDSITHTSTLRYILAPSTNTTWTFEGINRQVQFENPFTPDIEYNTGQVVWNRTAATLVISLAGGFTEAERTLERDDVDGFVLDLDAEWQARPTTQVTLTASRELNDQSDSLESGSFASDLDAAVNSDLGAIFTSERAGVTITQSLGRSTTLDLGADYEAEDYDDVTRDTETQTLRAGITRRLSPQLTLSARVSARNQEFSDENDETDGLRGDLLLAWDVGRRLNLGFGLQYEDRDSDSSFTSRSYDEWRAGITIQYGVIQ